MTASMCWHPAVMMWVRSLLQQYYCCWCGDDANCFFWQILVSTVCGRRSKKPRISDIIAASFVLWLWNLDDQMWLIWTRRNKTESQISDWDQLALLGLASQPIKLSPFIIRSCWPVYCIRVMGYIIVLGLYATWRVKWGNEVRRKKSESGKGDRAVDTYSYQASEARENFLIKYIVCKNTVIHEPLHFSGPNLKRSSTWRVPAGEIAKW